jgi:hypothetical protein
MKSGSINQPQKQPIKRQKAPGAEAVKKQANTQEAAKAPESTPVESTAEPGPKASGDTVPFGAVMDVSPDALAVKDDGKGGYESEMTLAFVKKSDRDRLEKEGAIFPEVGQAVLGDGVGPDGELQVLSLYDTENEASKNVSAAIEVDKSLLEIDPQTGARRIDSHKPIFLAEGEDVLPVGKKAVDQKSAVIPEGYVGTVGPSKAGMKTESKRILANNLTKTLGTFSGSSLAGFPFPLISNYAPILALGSAGFAFNQNMEARKKSQDELGYLAQQEKKSGTDMVELADEMMGQGTYKVSAKGHKKRLETQLRQANLQLASTGLLAAAGTTSIVGSLATAGVAGFAGMAGAAAATPFLAGASVLMGNGAMVFNALAELKDLSKEKTKLQALQEQGETHVDQVVEYMNVLKDPATGKVVAKRPEALGDEPVQMPISERLKQIDSAQRTQRFMAALSSGGFATVGSMLMGLGSLSVVGPLSLAPAAAVGGVQGALRLKELSGEKKKLLEAQENGETMIPQDIQQNDGTWKKERVPISTLLDKNRKEINKNKLIVTAAGTFGAMTGVTLGAGFSLLAAAPLALIPLAVGAALFPDKVKAFAGMVKNFLSGTVGELGSSARDVKKSTKKDVDKFSDNLDNRLAGLKESNPELFRESFRGSNPLSAGGDSLWSKTPPGYIVALKDKVKGYAAADSSAERHEWLREINGWLAKAPESAKASLGVLQEELTGLSMSVEAQWLARDISMEMKTPITEKVVTDDRVKSRVKELEFPTDTIRDQYEESLYIENSQEKYNELVHDRQAGDRDAARKLARAEVFKAARVLAIKERDLGVDLYTRYMDSIQRPEDEDNLDLLIKEVGYKQQIAVTGEEIEIVSAANRTLSTPLQMPPENPEPHVQKINAAVDEMKQADPEAATKLLDTDAKISNPETFKGMNAQEALAERTKLNAVYQSARRSLRKAAPDALKTYQEADSKLKTLARTAPKGPQEAAVPLRGPVARMENAYRSLSKQEPELAKQLGDAFAKLNNPSEYAGMTDQQIKATKTAFSLEFGKTRQKLMKKEPELMKLWDGARQEVENAYFDRSVDHDLKARVMSDETVTKRAKELGLNQEDIEGITTGLLKMMILEDRRALEVQLTDPKTGETIKEKAEIASLLDRALMAEATKGVQGGADFEAPERVSPQQDRNVQAFLQQNPQVVQVLSSPDFKALASQMNLSEAEVVDAYLERVQAELNPVVAAEFNGRLEGGDLQAKKTLDVSQQVIGLIQAATRPSPEMVQQQLDQSMDGTVVKTILSEPETQAKAEELGVNAEETMRLILTAEFSGDVTPLQKIEQQAQAGSTKAKGQLEMIQTLSQDLVSVSQQTAAEAQRESVPNPQSEAA